MLCLITLQVTNSSSFGIFLKVSALKNSGELAYCMRTQNAKLEAALPILVLIKINSLELHSGVKFTCGGYGWECNGRNSFYSS